MLSVNQDCVVHKNLCLVCGGADSCRGVAIMVRYVILLFWYVVLVVCLPLFGLLYLQMSNLIIKSE